MALSVRVDPQDTCKLLITPEVELTLKDRLAFEAAYVTSGAEITGYVVDLSKVTYIDSIGLGLLLNLKQYAQQKKAYFEVINLGELLRDLLNFPEVKDIFSAHLKKSG